MKKIKVSLLYAHIKKAIERGTEIVNLPESNATKKSIKSMGLIDLRQGSRVSDIEVIHTTLNKRIGLINNFIVVNKLENIEVKNNNITQGEYIIIPTINGLVQLKTILENYVKNNQANKEKQVYFKIIATEGEAQEGDNNPDDFSTASGVSQMSYVSGTTGTTYEESTIVTLHRQEKENLNSEIQRLNAEIETITQNAANEKQLLEQSVADLTRDYQVLQSQKTTQDAEIKNLNTQITNLNNQKAQQTTQVNNLNRQLSQANSQKQSLQNHLTAANNNYNQYYNLYNQVRNTSQSIVLDVTNTYTHNVELGIMRPNLITIHGVTVTPVTGSFTIRNVTM